MKTYTEEEVARLLDGQRANCWVALYNLGIRDKSILTAVLNASEPGQWKKNKSKKEK